MHNKAINIHDSRGFSKGVLKYVVGEVLDYRCGPYAFTQVTRSVTGLCISLVRSVRFQILHQK